MFKGKSERYLSVRGGMRVAVEGCVGHAGAATTSLLTSARVSEPTVLAWQHKAADALITYNRSWHQVAKDNHDVDDGWFDIVFVSADATNSDALGKDKVFACT